VESGFRGELLKARLTSSILDVRLEGERLILSIPEVHLPSTVDYA
jgi:hypothetical protein